MGLLVTLQLGYKTFVFLHGSARNDWDSRLSKANVHSSTPELTQSLILTEAIPLLKIIRFYLLPRSEVDIKNWSISLANWYAHAFV